MGTLFSVDGSSGDISTAGSLTASGSIISNSTTSGFLLPRLTTTQRNAIVSPATGLQIFNTTTNEVEFYNGTSWSPVGGGGSITALTGEVTATGPGSAYATLGKRTPIFGNGTPYTVLTTDFYIGVTTNTSPTNILLPQANTVPEGKLYLIKDESTVPGTSLGNAINIIPFSGDTLDNIYTNGSPLTLFQGGFGLILVSDGGSKWFSATSMYDMNGQKISFDVYGSPTSPNISLAGGANIYSDNTTNALIVNVSSINTLLMDNGGVSVTIPVQLLVGGTTLYPSAQLSVDSTTTGFLPPRMTTTQKNAIVSPATGLIVFDTTIGFLQEWNGSAWTSVAPSTGSGTVNSGTQFQLAYYATTGASVSGLTLITPSKVLVSDSNGLPVASSVTTTTLGFLDATSSIQTQLNGKLTSTLASADIFVGNGSNVATAVAASGDLTLANTGAFTIANLAVTAAKMANNTITNTQVASGVFANVTGVGSQTQNLDMNSHLINNVTNPVSAQDAATKQYVDNLINGLTYKFPTKYATVTSLPSYVYANGASGIGATITEVGFGALSIDGSTPSIGDRILVKNETSGNAPNNGIYTVTVVGDGSTSFILTRSIDYNQVSEIQPGDVVPVTAGSTLADTLWLETAVVATVGTDPITFQQFGQGTTYTADETTLHLSGTQFSIKSGGVSDAQINSSAAIAFSKLAALSSANILVGNGSNIATSVALSGDATLANTGALTLATVNGSSGSTTLSSITTNAKGLVTANTSATLASADIWVGNGSNVPTAVALSGDATLANTGALTLATVNSNVGSFTNANITVNAKGLITAAANGSGGGGGGKLLQMVSTFNSNFLNTADTTFVDVGISLSITPTLSTSSIKCTVVIGTVGWTAQTNPATVRLTVLRGSTNLGDAGGLVYHNSTISGDNARVPVTIVVIDSPSTTSSTTYKLQALTNSGNTMLVGSGDAHSLTMILEEIGA